VKNIYFRITIFGLLWWVPLFIC